MRSEWLLIRRVFSLAPDPLGSGPVLSFLVLVGSLAADVAARFLLFLLSPDPDSVFVLGSFRSPSNIPRSTVAVVLR
jgi:hypothetical protein